MAKRKPQQQKPKCLCCENLSQSRGLCWACNREALGKIESGEVTEQQLIDQRLILPRGKPGRRASGGLAEKLARVNKRKATA